MKIISSVTQVTFLVLTCHMRPVATILDNVAMEHLHHHRQICGTMVIRMGQQAVTWDQLSGFSRVSKL